MNLIKCSNGHFYDSDKWNQCPHCGENTINPFKENGDFWGPLGDSPLFPPADLGMVFKSEKKININELKNKTVFKFVPQEVTVYKNKAKLKCYFDYSGCNTDDYMYIVGLPYDYDIETLVINTFGVSYDSLSHFEYSDKEELEDSVDKDLHNYEKELEFYQTQKSALLKFLNSSVEKHDSINDCMTEWENCKKKYDEATEKIDEYINLVNELSARKKDNGKEYRGIKLRLNTEAENANGRFEMEILVSSITWQPEYVIEIGKQDVAEIKMRGLINSDFESDISGARVSLSTGIETGINAKSADKCILRKRPASPPLPGMLSMANHAAPKPNKQGTILLEEKESIGFASPAAPPAPNIIENELKSDDYSGSRTYSIESSLDIISGDVSEIIINRWTVPVRKRYIAISSKNNCASMIMSTEGFKEVLDRNTNVRLYYDGNYSGRDTSDNLINNASIVFGQVRDIKVYKNIEIDKKDKIPFKKTIREHHKYKITIKNKMNRDADIYVVDNIPTSFDEDIKIDVINADGAKIDDNTGIANWDIAIPSGASHEITVEYTVTYPEGVNIDRTR